LRSIGLHYRDVVTLLISSARGLMLSSPGETGPRSIRMDFLGLCVDCEVGFGQVIEKSTQPMKDP